jgi:S-adenosylmethionine:tRNA ribosyltransferase-isomerase
MSLLEKELEKYDYIFQNSLIAQKPATPRDKAKLLVYNRSTKTINHGVFANLDQYLPKNTILIFNNTKVIPARLKLKKQTGGACEILFIEKEPPFIRVLSDRKLSKNQRLSLSERYSFLVVKQERQFFLLKPSFPIAGVQRILHAFGHTPLPPYLSRSPLSEALRREKYQSIFAEKNGAIAAPTASLHFTKRLLKQMHNAGIETATITLHVGLGTFAPISEKQWQQGKLHGEWYEIPEKTKKIINDAKKDGRLVIAVGTTVVRALESAYEDGKMRSGCHVTRLFIRPSYRFRCIDGLITNFHVPRSSLMMLVASLVGRKKLLKLYREAMTKKYKLFSFGDGMLIL